MGSDNVNYVAIDSFLDDFVTFRKHCDTLSYEGEMNPVDGIFYPGVNINIPEQIKQFIIDKLELHFGRPITPRAMFLRLTTLGADAPHQAHTDLAMSKLGMMLYMNRLEDCLGGTSFVIHKKTGLKENPINKKQEDVWREDTNNPDAWSILDMCSMVPNRAMIFDSSKMHRAEPIGGFGEGAEDGRLVLVFFFD